MEKNHFVALREALYRRRDIIADREYYHRDAAGHLEALKSVSEQIIEISSELPEALDPQFKHYLARCSYDKALAWLEEHIDPTL